MAEEMLKSCVLEYEFDSKGVEKFMIIEEHERIDVLMGVVE